MRLEKATRKQAKIKLSLAGSAGSGKTYSALLLAHGLCGDYTKIAVIDTENYSASLYSHLGSFQVINMTAPFQPEKFVEAIQICENAGVEVIIIDSISHEWSGKGGCLDIHEQEIAKMRFPNSFTAWASVTPRHRLFVDTMLNSPVHIICTLRSKTEYILTERNGKQVPQKVGLAPITRDGFDFEVTIAFDLDQQHKAFCTKDRTGLFIDKEPALLGIGTGQLIAAWCQEGEAVTVDDVSKRISDTASIKELLEVYKMYPQYKDLLKPEYEQRKRQLLINQEVQNNLINLNQSANGTGHGNS